MSPIELSWTAKKNTFQIEAKTNEQIRRKLKRRKKEDWIDHGLATKLEWETISQILKGALRKKGLHKMFLFLKRREAARQPVDKHIAKKDKAGRQNPTVETNLQQF